MEDIRGPYFRGLEESPSACEHWRGLDPDDGETESFFETVEDDEGRRIAIKQIILYPSDTIDRYCGGISRTRMAV